MRGVSTVLGEIAFFLALAGLIGIGIGWVLRDWAFYNKAEELARPELAECTNCHTAR